MERNLPTHFLKKNCCIYYISHRNLLYIIIWIESLSSCSELLAVNVEVEVSEAEVDLKVFNVTSCFEAYRSD
jgi:hypothetical protein